jgi:hypothetical protein
VLLHCAGSVGASCPLQTTLYDMVSAEMMYLEVKTPPSTTFSKAHLLQMRTSS